MWALKGNRVMFAAHNYSAITSTAVDDNGLAEDALECVNDAVSHFIQHCKSRGVLVALDGRIKPAYKTLSWVLVQSSPWLKAALERHSGPIKQVTRRKRVTRH